MKSFLLLFLATSIFFAIYHFSFRDTATPASPSSTAQNVATTTSSMPTITADWIEENKGNTAALPPGRVESHDTHNTYINESWGFTFNFPKDWELTEPAFGSGSTLFNLDVSPIKNKRFPKTIFVNITPKSWIDRVLHEEETKDIANFTITETIFVNKKAFFNQGVMFSVIPYNSYLIPVQDLYWIDVGSIDDSLYAEEWGMVRDSFQFLE